MVNDIDKLDSVAPGHSSFKQVEATEGLFEPSAATLVTGIAVRRLPAIRGFVNIIYAEETNTEDVYLGLSGGGWMPLAAGEALVLEGATRFNLGSLEVNSTRVPQKLTILSYG